jgi:hypothetical protein
VKVGGPLRGMRRAFRIAVGYAASCLVWGAVSAIVLAALFESEKNGRFLLVLLGLHVFLTLCVVLPTSFLANCFFVRWFRRRNWRGEMRRYWAAGFLGISVTWSGMVVYWNHGLGLPIVYYQLFGVGLALTIQALSTFVPLSNLGLLLAWLLPGRKQ